MTERLLTQDSKHSIDREALKNLFSGANKTKSYVGEETSMPSKEIQHQKLYIPRVIGVINTRRPAFLEILNSNSGKDLVVSSFCPFTRYNEVKIIPKVNKIFETNGKLMPNREISATKDIYWPNDIKAIDKKLFGKEGFLVAGGFMLMPKAFGEVSFIEKDTLKKIKLTEDKKNWFYHEAIPYDLKGDGNIGVLTARCNKSMFSFAKSEGELVWLEKPDVPGQYWKEHILVKGPDVCYVMGDINQDGNREMIANDFFNNKLYLVTDDNGKYEKFEFDKKIKKPFDLELADVNNDGRLELIVTNHTNNGSIYVYEIPKDIKHGEWIRHEILSNVKTRKPLPSEGAPGNVICFYPQKGMPGKPYIVASGDGSGKVHMLVPKKPFDPNNWEYDEKVLFKENCTVGKVKLDYGNDGFARLFVPLYEKNQILCYSFDNNTKMTRK